MKPGDFYKYAAMRVPRSLTSKVQDVLGPRALKGGVLRATPDMPVERMQQLLERSGVVEVTPSRFPGLEPVITPKGIPAKSPPKVDYPKYRDLQQYGVPGHLPWQQAEADLLVQEQNYSAVRQAMQDELGSLARSRSIKETTPVRRYLREKPHAFAISDQFSSALGKWTRPTDRMFAEQQYRRRPTLL